MGRCGQQKAPCNENDVNDLEEAAANGEENLAQGLDILEQIFALLPEGIDVFINFEEVDDVDQEGIFMSLPPDEWYPEEAEFYPEDNDTWRRAQLKSALVDDHYDEHYACSCEEDQDDYEDQLDQLTSQGQSDQLFRLSALPFNAGLYYDDPLAQEEIAMEILELEHLVNSEFSGSSIEPNHYGMPEDDFKQNCSECMNKKE